MSDKTSAKFTAMTVEEACAAYGEDARWELIEGEVIEMTPAGNPHGQSGMRLLELLMRWKLQLPASRDHLSFSGFEVGWMLPAAPETLLAPDLSITDTRRLRDLQRPNSPWNHGSPDVAIEIVSPSDKPHVLRRKIGLYLGAGSREVWLLDPKQQLLIVHCAESYRAREYAPGDTYEGTGILEGFRLPVAELFRAP